MEIYTTKLDNRVIMGKYSYISSNKINIWWAPPESRIIIGNFCSISSDLTIFLGGNHNVNWTTTFPFGHINADIFNNFSGEGHPTTNGNVVIGNDVYIGKHVTIMSGVTIGDGAVVACNSHVVKNIPAYAVVGGNPATIIKYRHSEEQLNHLLKIKWWNWTDYKINKFVPLLCNVNIDRFIETANAYID